MSLDFIIYLFVIVYGVVVGSFLNVCIIRIPERQTIVTKRSHCMNCNYQLKWYDLVPLISWLLLRGKCRECKMPISKQYPIIEAVNGLIWLATFLVRGIQFELLYDVNSLLYCTVFSCLLVLSVIDYRTYEIPIGCNVFILAVGLIHLCMDYSNWLLYVIGLIAVSLFLYIIYIVTNGRGIGGGDVKLMAVSGLLLGWKLNLLALILGCVLGSVFHIVRMKLSDEDNVLAMGPYLSMGIFISILWGNQIINWYIGYIG